MELRRRFLSMGVQRGGSFKAESVALLKHAKGVKGLASRMGLQNRRGAVMSLSTTATPGKDPSTYDKVAIILEDGSVFEGRCVRPRR